MDVVHVLAVYMNCSLKVVFVNFALLSHALCLSCLRIQLGQAFELRIVLEDKVDLASGALIGNVLKTRLVGLRDQSLLLD
jgi:hypothetical protein